MTKRSTQKRSTQDEPAQQRPVQKRSTLDRSTQQRSVLDLSARDLLARDRSVRGSAAELGFTLLELIVVLIIIGTLAAIAVPAFTHHIKVSREAVLKEDLHVIRQAIDSYTVDKQKAPQSGEDLVTSGYLKSMPRDPMTNRADTWTFDRTDSYSSVDETTTGINDVHSGSGSASTEGPSYSTW